MPRAVASTKGTTGNGLRAENSAVYTTITEIASTSSIVARATPRAIVWAELFHCTIKTGPLVVTLACIVDACTM
jgi:hypothetical protein